MSLPQPLRWSLQALQASESEPVLVVYEADYDTLYAAYEAQKAEYARLHAGADAIAEAADKLVEGYEAEIVRLRRLLGG